MFAVKENPPCRHIANIQASYQLQNKDHSLNFVMHADNKYRVRQVVAELGLFDLDLKYTTILLCHGKSSHLCQVVNQTHVRDHLLHPVQHLVVKSNSGRARRVIRYASHESGKIWLGTKQLITNLPF